MKYRVSASSAVGFVSVAFVFGFVPACTAGIDPTAGNGTGQTSTTSTSTSGGTFPGGETGTDAGDTVTTGCAAPTGTYKLHYTVSAGSNSTSCTAPNDTTVTLGSSADAGSSCTTEEDSVSCTFTTDCESDVNGDTTDITESVTVTNGKPTGTITEIVTQDSSGTSLINCTYDVTYTKQ